ncbi:MAG: AI-2E family transporter [Bacteroidales bacterium]
MKHVSHFLLIAIAVVIILIYGKNLIMPFVLALLLWFMTREIRFLMDKVYIIKHKVPVWIKNLFSFCVIIFILTVFFQLVLTSINNLIGSYSQYQDNVDVLIKQANEFLEIDILEFVKGNFTEFNIGSVLKMIFNSFTEIISSTFMILIYALFLFLEEAYFDVKIKKMFANKGNFDKVQLILERIEISVAKYLGMKTIISLCTGLLSFVVFFFIDIESPVFWASLVFILNYIPNIGSLIASIFPALFCLLQFGEFMPGLIVLISIGTIQMIVGNILEPKLMGDSMNISPLVTIISLAFWGSIWGITGMMLSVPVTVTILIIFSQFNETKSFAILLSEKGRFE